MLQGLNQYCGSKNLSSLSTIEYAPIDWINQGAFERVISSDGNWLFNVLFTSGDWLKAYILPAQKIWTERQRSSDQGPIFDQEVNAVAPNLSPAVSKELDQMARMFFLLRLTDKSGQKWILGSLDSPFQFTSRGGTDNKSHEISFFTQTAHKAAGFDPVFNI